MIMHHCCSKFLFSLKQQYRTKNCAIVPNKYFFIPIILKFEKFIYYSNGKVIYYFCTCGYNASLRRWEEPSPGEKFLNTGIFFTKSVSKYAELMVELYICDNLNQIYRFVPF